MTQVTASKTSSQSILHALRDTHATLTIVGVVTDIEERTNDKNIVFRRSAGVLTKDGKVKVEFWKDDSDDLRVDTMCEFLIPIDGVGAYKDRPQFNCKRWRQINK